MSTPIIQPDKGQVIHVRSIWADYCNGLVSPECVSWAHLLGLDVFGELNEVVETDLYLAAYEDTEGFVEAWGSEDGLIEQLRKGAAAFRFWWAAESRLNDPEEIYDACYLLAERVSSPSDFILERAGKAICVNLTQ